MSLIKKLYLKISPDYTVFVVFNQAAFKLFIKFYYITVTFISFKKKKKKKKINT